VSRGVASPELTGGSERPTVVLIEEESLMRPTVVARAGTLVAVAAALLAYRRSSTPTA